METRHIAAWGIFFLLANPASASRLIQGGKPVGKFIVEPAGHQAAKFATEDVLRWIEKITGARVQSDAACYHFFGR